MTIILKKIKEYLDKYFGSEQAFIKSSKLRQPNSTRLEPYHNLENSFLFTDTFRKKIDKARETGYNERIDLALNKDLIDKSKSLTINNLTNILENCTRIIKGSYSVYILEYMQKLIKAADRVVSLLDNKCYQIQNFYFNAYNQFKDSTSYRTSDGNIHQFKYFTQQYFSYIVQSSRYYSKELREIKPILKAAVNSENLVNIIIAELKIKIE